MINKIINSEDPKFQSETISELVFDTTPTVNSFNTVTSDGVARAIAGASGQVPQVTKNDNGKVLTAVYDAGGPAVEWAEAQGGSSYTAGDGIDINGLGEISIFRDESGGISFNDSGGVMLDYDTIVENSNGTFVETIDNNAVVGVQVANPVPETSGASQGDVLTIGSNGPEWAAPSAGKPYIAGDGINISEYSLNKVISVKLGKGFVVSDDLLVSDTWLSGSTSPAIGVTDNIKQGNTCKVYLNVAGAASRTSQDTFTITASAAQAGLPIRLAFGSNSGYGWKEIVSGYNLKTGAIADTKTLVEGANSIDGLWYEANMWTGAFGLFPNSTEYALAQAGLKANGTTYAKLYAWDTTNNVAVGDPLVAVNAKVVISTDATAKIKFNLAPSSGISFTSSGRLRVDPELPWFDPTDDAGKVLAINSSGYLQWMNLSDL
ncbi:hypothetical protein [Fibrobacter sp. UWP2]|uniref:hypothetical protein n=1 Tax=Fibrobacter sp. UWP2 TaxID=1896216 RepID=UPI000916ED1F|nr:hypothetical protein [Fibrobacter sp. UWP2]SHI35066.1 hypothetical protein SAMN05720471_101250 [Fibrobacter sp. UWP2]